MKLHQCLALAGALLLSSIFCEGATAQAQLLNRSLRIHRGRCSCGFGLNYYLYFSTYYTEFPSQVNEELGELPAGANFSHWAYLLLEDASTAVSVTYARLDLPPFGDADGNGVSDFFDIPLSASAVTHGTYEIDWGPGTLTAVWTRNSWETQGSLDLTLTDSILGDIGPFHHTFDLVQYSGSLAYTPGSNNVTGTVSLLQEGNTNAQVLGTVQFLKAPTNRFNTLLVQSSTWNSSDTGPLALGESVLTRNPSMPARYFAPVLLGTGAYSSWTLAINDTNDSNHNGIPDLSDDPALPVRPVLSLQRSAGNLQFTINGEVGRTYVLQEATAPDVTSWSTAQIVQLTNAVQTIWLPMPAERSKFWRLVAQ